jgi:hypothetical protein
VKNFEYLCIRETEEHSIFIFFQGSNGGMAKSIFFFLYFFLIEWVGEGTLFL